MSIRSVKSIGQGEFAVDRLQEYIATAFDGIQKSEIINGVLLKDVALINGATEVAHKLGRELRGWIVVGQSASASIWDSQATHTRKRKTLMLNSSAAVTVSLWVF